MTRDSGFKRRVRDRARRTGESYSTARAHLLRRSVAADGELVARCAAPMLPRLRAADAAARRAVLPALTREQGVLLAFWMLFVHTGDGVTGLCRVHPHRLGDPDFWTLLETGLREDAALLGVITRLRAEVESTLEHAPDHGDYSWLDRMDTATMRELDAEFRSVMPASLHQMADRIRAHPDRFATGEAMR